VIYLTKKYQNGGTVSNIFDKIEKERGGLAAIHSEFSEFEDGVDGHYYLYKKIMLNENLPLPREEREYIAYKVSLSNECPYCISHHKKALDNNFLEIPLDLREFYDEFAQVICTGPWKTCLLKKRYLDLKGKDACWQHLVMVASYYNMANRIAFAMELELESTYEDTCK